ncbi:hypothetical protein SAY86_029944 [Trapa natans]|uniref:Nitrate regulatory gene2 protein-like n=1 Tax=Trapa natans TaxID=22666 RepID=A0AAN7MPL5_TRANT|nr:hypothetical protein SAY86_029944 [Trapa natans]
MGCVASKLEKDGEAVAICRERKKLLKQAVERRYALAEAHFRYCQALYAVSAAIKLFVARHSSPSSPFLITFSPATPPPESSEDLKSGSTASAKLLQQKPSESKSTTTTTITEAVACGSSSSCGTSSSESEEDEKVETGCGALHNEEQVYGYYYMQTPPPMPSPQMEYGWDFFNLFDTMRPDLLSGYTNKSHHLHSYDDHIRTVREQEGIPELEEEGEEEEEDEQKEVIVEEHNAVNTEGDCGGEAKITKESGGADILNHTKDEQGKEENRELTVGDAPEKGRDRELLDALRDIEMHFVRAYDSGKDVSRMLEANRVHLQSNLDGIKEHSTKLIQSIAWHRSTSLKPASCKSLVASSSLKDSSTWAQFKNMFEGYGGMVAGSHSLTLERLYAWEKKLYEEVKGGDGLRKLYQRKCAQMKNQDVRGISIFKTDKTRASVKDLYARILVAIRSAESISGRIQKLRDEELQPQIIELLKGLTQTWKIMLESHDTQNKILSEVGTFSCPTYGKFMNDSHRLATLQLEAEIQNWRTRLMDYMSAQKGYIQAIHGWLTKFLAPEVEFYSGGRGCPTPWPGQCHPNGPQLLPICYGWLNSMDKLPVKSAAFALKSFTGDVRAIWAQQGEEQQLRRRVEDLVKELDKRSLMAKKAETWYLDYKPADDNASCQGAESHMAEHMSDKWDPLEALRLKLETEREKHHRCIQATQRTTLSGFQTGFGMVFEALTEFSKAVQSMYNELVKYGESMNDAGNLLPREGPAEMTGDELKR